MANDNIKRYLDYDGLVYLINKFNSVIEANEYTTSEALNDLNRKIAELNINDNTGGFPIIDADITQVDSVYTTTENLNELITPGQYIVDSSKIQYEEDNFVKTLYWLLSVDKVVYDNSESIIQTYYPLSYLSYNWYNIPIGGLLQRFYEGNNTWTDLQVAAPGDVDPSKFVTKNEFDTEVQSINEEIDNINEIIEGLNKTDNDTKCETGTINAGTPSEAPTEGEVTVIKNESIPLSGDGTYLSGDATAVNVVTKKYVDENFTTKSEKDIIWEKINEDRVSGIALNRSGIRVTKDLEEVDVPYIENKVTFIEQHSSSPAETGYFVGHFDVISLPTKNYVINNYVSNQTLSTTLNDYISNQTLSTTLNDYVSNQTLSTTLNDYVDKASVIPNILKNGTPLGSEDYNNTLQWYRTSAGITDINSTDYHDICAPSYSDFNETSASFNINSMVIRGFWSKSYFHDIWMSPNTEHILHRSIDNGTAKPWKILLDNANCGKYIKNVIKESVDTDQLKINNHFYCNPYANFFNSIGIYNSKNIEIVSAAQSKLPSESGASVADLGTDAGDIIFYKKVGKTYKNPDESLISDWPNFTGAQTGGSFSEHYSPIEIGRIYTTYISDKCKLMTKRAIGLQTEGNPQNTYINAEIVDESNFPYYLQRNNVITNSNISSNLPSTVITTSNISNYSSKSSEYIKIDNVNNISEYNDCAYFVTGNSTNINEGTGPEPNKIYKPKYTPLENFINGNASGNPTGAFISSMAWTSTLRLFFNSKYFYDVQFDPNNENIIHRLVCNGTSKPWHLLLDSNNYNDFFKVSHLTPKSLTVTNKITAGSIDTPGKLTVGSIDVTYNINVGGGVYETSDETLKDFQDSIQVNFEQLKEIPKAYFTFKDDKTGETKIGTSAQKVKEFYPELVSEDENGILSVDYAKLSMVALKAVDELDNRISKLEKLVVQLLENK